jgi:hypothetical protein
MIREKLIIKSKYGYIPTRYGKKFVGIIKYSFHKNYNVPKKVRDSKIFQLKYYTLTFAELASASMINER